jgi:hypothetical protein
MFTTLPLRMELEEHCTNKTSGSLNKLKYVSPSPTLMIYPFKKRMTFDSPMIAQRRRLEGEESRKRRSIIRLKFSILRQKLQVGMFTLVLGCHLVI